MSTEPADNLTPKQRRFVTEYLKDLNGKHAAIRAGYKASRAEQTASELLANRKVSEAVAAAQARIGAATEVETARIVEHQGWIATFDRAELYDEHDVIKPVRQLPKHVRCCLASIDVLKVNLVSGDHERQTIVRYKFHDKGRAAELEYRRRGLLKDKLEVTGTLDLEGAWRVPDSGWRRRTTHDPPRHRAPPGAPTRSRHRPR